MNYRKVIFPALVAGMFLGVPSSYGQLAKDSNVSLSEIVNEVNKLLSNPEDASKAKLNLEVEALIKAKSEYKNLMGASIYSYIGEKEKGDKVREGLAKKYPKGITAREQAFNAILDNEKLSAAKKLKEYDKWKKKFPRERFEQDLKDNKGDFGFNTVSFYDMASSRLASQLIKEGAYQELNTVVEEIRGTRGMSSQFMSLSKQLIEKGENERALALIEEAYNGENAKEEKSRNPRLLGSLASSYAEALNKAGNADKAVEVLEAKKSADPSTLTSADVVLLSDNYNKAGKKLDAFRALESYYVHANADESILEKIAAIYTELNQGKSDVERFKVALNDQVQEAKIAKYKSEMIRKDAPGFTLVGLDGKEVSLADYKDKIVIIDFWATWCGPCINSFPGMQKVVEKYADDSEVAILFIATWQREENYKEVVENFITENNYSFHVLLDEMKDKDKAVVSAYEVSGIPTKIFIDKSGDIRFISVGSGSDVDAIMDDMTTRIELLKQES